MGEKKRASEEAGYIHIGVKRRTSIQEDGRAKVIPTYSSSG